MLKFAVPGDHFVTRRGDVCIYVGQSPDLTEYHLVNLRTQLPLLVSSDGRVLTVCDTPDDIVRSLEPTFNYNGATHYVVHGSGDCRLCSLRDVCDQTCLVHAWPFNAGRAHFESIPVTQQL